ncbi:hypothetical protein HK414_16490 [Ramlibacter terrae]|uniref:Uncharacterized protein n=1 Tax=Ramlibacter terrae TaxID=2732511 RepID=A0ABX6P6V4_9BURK|nr:hypothetical protein HK414_16490 [Ramlibacter terrae]
MGSGPDTFGFTVADDGGIAGGGANSLAQSLSVTVVNRAPVLTGANALPGKLEDAAAGNGMLVADLIAGRITDPQNTFGIAVISASSPGGTGSTAATTAPAGRTSRGSASPTPCCWRRTGRTACASSPMPTGPAPRPAWCSAAGTRAAARPA